MNAVDQRSARRRVGAVTIGQTPRTDVTFDIAPLLGSGIELVEAGALDELDDFESLAPENDEPVLASRLRDGLSVIVSERRVLPLVQQALDRVADQGVEAIILLCTATGPSALACSVPIIHPNVVLTRKVVAAAGNDRRVAIVVPDQAQVEDIGSHWEAVLGRTVDLYVASPYGPSEPRRIAAEQIAATDADLVVLDCIGYSVAMAEEIRRISGKQVIVPRIAAAEAVKDLL